MGLFVVNGFAQETTGRISGRVITPDGRPLSGVRVLLQGPALGVRETQTDGEGMFRFRGLPPDEAYELRFERKGFRSVVRAPVAVRVGATVRVQVVMMPVAAEMVVVTAPPPLPDVRKVEVAVDFQPVFLERLPTARDPWSLLELAPGVIVRDVNVGGARSGTQAFFYGRGEGRKNAHWYLDGVLMTDPAERGMSLKFYDFDAIEEVYVVTGAADVEAFTGGVTVNLITRRGTNTWEGGGRLAWTDYRLQAENTDGVRFFAPESRGNRIDRFRDLGGFVGGPLLRNRAWFWTGYGVQTVAVFVPGVMRDVHTWSRLDDLNVKGHVLTGSHVIEGQIAWNQLHRKGVGVGFDRPAPTAWNLRSQTPFVKVQDEWTLHPHLSLTWRFGAVPGYRRERIPAGGVDRPVLYDLATGIWDASYRWDRVRRMTVQGTVQGVWDRSTRWGNHEVKVGAEFRGAWAQSRVNWGSGIVFIYDDRRTPALGGEVAFFREGFTRLYVHRWSLYAQDTWQVGRWTLVAGLRWDRQWSGLQRSSVAPHPWVPAWLPGGETRPQRLPFTWNTLSPRLAIAYDLTGQGTMVLKAGVALYPATLDTHQAADMATTALREIRFRWTGDLDGNGTPDLDEIDLAKPIFWDHFPGDPNRVVNAVDPAFASPLNLEILGGLDAVMTDWRFSVYGFYRRLYRRKEPFPYDPHRPGVLDIYYNCWVEVGRVPETWGGWPYYACTVPKPPGVYWTNQLGYHRDYYGLEFRVERSLRQEWGLMGSLTLERFVHHYTSRQAYLDPTNIEQLNGAAVAFGGANVRWIAKLLGTVRLPGDLWLGATLVARDGFPFLSRYRVTRPSNGWGRTVDVYTHRVGALRLPVFWTLHLRLERDFHVRSAFQLQAALEVFNVTNNAIVLGWYDRADRLERYRTVTALTTPRVIRLSLRLRLQ